MAINTTGAELKAFWASDDTDFWPKDSYVEGLVVEMDGREVGAYDDFEVDSLLDDQKVKILYGDICLDNGTKSFEREFRRWRKTQTHAFVTAQVPKDRLEEVKAAIKACGGTVR